MQELEFENGNTKDNVVTGSCCGEKSASLSRPEIMRKACGQIQKEDLPPWAMGTIPTAAGMVLRVSDEWSSADYWGMIKSRVGAFRMNYAVKPGLYSIGEPTKDSDVFVSANYKLSFDTLRRSLKGLSAWVLVLDTKGINVWCAAGKGTFGTDELIKRISESKLDAVVSHRRIILPQLGAVGVSASAVRVKTGFRVSFGPVDAHDIQAYIRANYKKTEEMSTVKFSMHDRLVLTPMEVIPAMKKFFWLSAVILLIFGLQPSGILFAPAWFNSLPVLLLGLIAVFAGAFVTPVLLPYIPFRSFAIKGWIAGVLSVLLASRSLNMFEKSQTFMTIVSYLVFPALSSYIALQFTGSTTFTSISGVKKELKIGIPIYIGAAGIFGVFLVVSKFKEWGIV